MKPITGIGYAVVVLPRKYMPKSSPGLSISSQTSTPLVFAKRRNALDEARLCRRCDLVTKVVKVRYKIEDYSEDQP